MLDFFRRYQRYFFFVITVVIIISFSFFGTYSTIGSDHWREQVVFTAIDGSDISRSDVDEMAIFIATDKNDKILFGGAWGPNFLNDGVIRSNFLETGLANELVKFYESDLQEDFQRRLEREKKYKLYTHPNAPFIGVESVWAYFNPEMQKHYQQLRAATTATTPDAFDNRVKLYLEERKFPSTTAKYVIRHQEKQYSWITPDYNLDNTDLSLFGYHTTEDWFGPHFTRLVSQFIINAAILAEQQGYQVSKAEAMADLIRNTQISYQEHEDQDNIGVTSPEEYLSEQLRRLNMDQARAVKIWRQVLLFRRYFQDAGNAALVDTLAYTKFNQFVNESLAVEIYQLPKELRLGDFDSLQKLEFYISAVSKPAKDKLALPTEFLAETEIAKNYPELIQKRYALEVAQTTQKNIQSRISIKEMWNWEADEKNWDAIKKQFPELALKVGQTRDDRMEALDSLDKISRAKVDAFARDAILKNHPEWITQALDQAPSQKVNVGLRAEGGSEFFSGLDSKEKRTELMKQLDAATLETQPDAKSPLHAFTADNQVYYRIVVLEKAAKPEILTFAEANSDGTLNALRNRLLEKHYVATRSQNLLQYQNENKEWRPFDSVKDLVAASYFKDTLAALENVKKEGDAKISKDKAASLRLYKYVEGIKAKIEKDPIQGEKFVRSQPKTDENHHLATRTSLKDQWLLEKEEKNISRQSYQDLVDATEAFAMKEKSWSDLKTPPNGQLAFYQVKGKATDDALVTAAIAKQTREAQAVLSGEAQRTLMNAVLTKIKDKNAISLAYLLKPEEERSAGTDITE
jgi:GcvH upstream region-like protein